MCGEFMHLEERVQVDRIPGTSQVTSRTSFEWVCAECDYFEEHEAAERPEGAEGDR
jgi:hypothetical protein